MCALLHRLRPIQRALARHAQRLRQALDSLAERLRDSVALTIGQTVATAVHEAVQAVLTARPTYPTWPDRRPAPQPTPSLWGEREYPAWDDDLEESLPEDDDAACVGPSDTQPSSAVRLPRAVAAGLQTAAWWLRRQAGKCSLAVAAGIGLLTALGAYAGGSVTAAGLGLTGAALSLLSLAQTVQASAGLLAGLPTR